MSVMKDFILTWLPDAQCGDEEARLRLLTAGIKPDFKCVSDMVTTAAEYRLKGWSVVPQLPGAKQPCVKWKPYQTRLPTVEELVDWWTRWPDAGIAVVLGPVSNLFAVDVDGEDAHKALVRNLGGVPGTAKSLSGSGKRYRYHLLFSHPPIETNAKFCPWCPTLEFRGHGGIIVLPPSRHKSGGRYRWADGASSYEIDLLEVPAPIVRALRARTQQRKPSSASVFRTVATSTSTQLGLARHVPNFRTLHIATRSFLYGEYADGPDWNCRLFRAACDLAGNGISKETATSLLLAGAQPWNAEETQHALTTIESAFSEQRYPAERRPKRVRTSVSKGGKQA